MRGRIHEVGLGDLRLVLDDSKVALPLHVTSSLVTELAPLIMLLKQGISGTLIFEEPEAHLHLIAQRAIARALVKLVNAGVPVVLTTHSDTFLQQINILMQLHGHPDRAALAEKFGYDPTEFLDPTDARGYAFDPTANGTVVRELTKTALGFVEPVMNQAIAEMTHEVITIGTR